VTPRRATRAVAVDLGTSQDRVWVGGRDLLVETAVPARHPLLPITSGRPVPLNTDALVASLQRCLPRSVRRWHGAFPVAVAIDTAAAAEERRVIEAAVHSINNNGPVLLVESALAAAAGADFDITGSCPRLVVDIGARRTEVAVLADGHVLAARDLAAGCVDVEEAVLAYLYQRHRLVATPRAARQALQTSQATGIPADGSQPATVYISAGELTAATKEPASAVVQCVRRVIDEFADEQCAPALLVAGGGAAFPTVVETLTKELPAAVKTALDPRRAVIRGMALVLDEASRRPELWMAA
jgi:rod shape-determining protein MreB